MESTHTPQRALIKLLAIVGFFVLLALIIWAVVQGLRAFPSAFSSLASIAETVNNYHPKDDFSVVVQKSIVNSGETFTVTWNEMRKGTYVFGYSCASDVKFSIRTAEGSLQTITCADTLVLPAHVTGIFATVETKSQRFSDVPFKIAFDPEKGETVVVEKRITVVNATVPQVTDIAATTTPVVVVTPKPATTTKPVVTTPKPAPVKPAPTLVTTYPVSNPNGYTDLKITFLGVGKMVSGTFVATSAFDEDDRAAFRFEVKNIGTKTSNDWSYELELPEGNDYSSGTQAPLRPTEYAIFTVGFDLTDESDSSETVSGELEVTGDNNSKNNSFEQTVRVND
jgi:hypothetical protein